MTLPLEGIMILDFSRILAGPFCTMLLADMGAEVIKAEKIGVGDDSRHFGPPFKNGESAYFLSINRNKKSIAIDLKKRESKDIINGLIEKSDVLVENFLPGTMEKMGYSYKNVKKMNPGIIYTSISGFGQTGPMRNTPGYDLLIQGMSGLMSLNGEPDGTPYKVGISMGDLAAGLFAAQGILLALYQREKTGEGKYIDISLLDSLTSLLTFQASRYFMSGKNPARMGNQHPTICPYETFPAKDGHFNLAVGNDKIWKNFCRVMGLEHIADTPKFSSNPERVKNRDELYEILCEIFREKTVKHWLNLFEYSGIPCGAINTVEETLNMQQLKDRDMIMELDHLSIGKVNVLGNPANIKGSGANSHTPPPVLGQNTGEILTGILGYTEEHVAFYKENGVIG